MRWREPFHVFHTVIEIRILTNQIHVLEMLFYNTVWKTWKYHAIAYAIMNSTENLRFDKEGYFHVLVFYGLFYKKNRKQFFWCSHTL